MKRKLLVALILCLFVLSGCQANNAPTLGQVPPTATPEPTKPPTEMPKTAEPIATTQPSMVEKFDAPDNWLQAHTVTSQALPGKGKTVVEVKDGALNFAIPDPETYVYTFYKNPQPADTVTEVKVENVGKIDNALALVCRATPDYGKWYEVRVSYNGLYKLLKYDASLKDQGEIPYKTLKTGTAPKNTILPLKPNYFKFICKGQSLTLEINGGKFSVSEQNADLPEGGLVGLGSMSFADLPVKLKFDDFMLSQPK
jgi:hypothetical protein